MRPLMRPQSRFGSGPRAARRGAGAHPRLHPRARSAVGLLRGSPQPGRAPARRGAGLSSSVRRRVHASSVPGGVAHRGVAHGGTMIRTGVPHACAFHGWSRVIRRRSVRRGSLGPDGGRFVGVLVVGVFVVVGRAGERGGEGDRWVGCTAALGGAAPRRRLVRRAWAEHAGSPETARWTHCGLAAWGSSDRRWSDRHGPGLRGYTRTSPAARDSARAAGPGTGDGARRRVAGRAPAGAWEAAAALGRRCIGRRGYRRRPVDPWRCTARGRAVPVGLRLAPPRAVTGGRVRCSPGCDRTVGRSQAAGSTMRSRWARCWTPPGVASASRAARPP